MALGIARLVLPVSVRLVLGIAPYLGACGPGPGTVGVDVGHPDDQPAVDHRRRPGRLELFVGQGAVQPDRLPFGFDLPVDRVGVPVEIDPARAEPERFDQEVVRSLNVLVDQHGDDRFGVRRHGDDSTEGPAYA